ncbi:HAD hydrolase family protein [Nocardia vermiculata]|uniref:HAD hydrolase family protein n=2 Tax=Nocardia vermiculata TaxID=257274 RepID=A0A846XRS3_9NOCA|nr:HAD hydrolase family protein [Nocardia vermiculata]
MSPRVRAAIRAAVDSDTHVVITTGRTLLATRLVMAELGLESGHAICSNGAVHVDISSWEPLAVRTFDPGRAIRVLRALLPDMVLAVEKVGIGTWTTGFYPGSFRLGEFRFVDDAELSLEPTTRLNGYWPGRTHAEMLEVVGELDLPGAGWWPAEDEAWLVASKPGVSKGWALEQLRVELGVAPEDTLAIGDGYNDVEMLGWAGHSVAMGNAVPAAREIADEITADIAADGAALVLERWFTD